MNKTKTKTKEKDKDGLRDEIAKHFEMGRSLVYFVYKHLKIQFRKGYERNNEIISVLYEFCASKGRLSTNFEEAWSMAEESVIESGICPTCSFDWDEDEDECSACGRGRQESN